MILCETWFKSSILTKLNGFFIKLPAYENVLYTGLRFLVLGNILDEFSICVVANARNLISKTFTSYEHLKKTSCDKCPGVPLLSPISCLWVSQIPLWAAGIVCCYIPVYVIATMRRPLELTAWMAIFFMKGTFKITSVVSPVHPCQTTEYFLSHMMGNGSAMKLVSSYRQRLGGLTERRLVVLRYTLKFTTLR